MKIFPMTHKLHYFVCEQCSFKTDEGVDCHKDTARNFRKKLKEMTGEKFTKTEVRINGAQCLGQCEHGISSVLYPDGKFLLGLRPGDEENILKYLEDEIRGKS